MTKVSVILAVYNGAAFLAEALESVGRQTCGSWEIVAVNDGSTDRSGEILEEYRSRYGQRMQVITQENAGISRARNAAIAAAGGEYIALLDSDDVWMPEKLEEQVRLLDDEREIALVYSDSRLINQAGRVVAGRSFGKSPCRGSAFSALLIRNCIPSSSVVVRRSVLDAVGAFHPEYRIAMDYDLWLRIADRYPIDVIDRPLLQYRVHPGGISSNRAEMIREDLDITEKWLQLRPELREDLAESLLQKKRNYRYHLFLHHLHSRELRKAAQAFLSWLVMALHRAPEGRSEIR